MAALMERDQAMAVTADQLDLVKRTVAQGATDAELKLFLYDCQRRGIHPLDKLLHFTKRGGRYTPVTSIDFMRSQAAMTGEMAGSDDPVFENEIEPQSLRPLLTAPPRSASVTVYRLTQGQRFAYTATARWAEYCPDNAPMWKRMPHTMLGKCAEALALRKAFPQQLAGLYTTDEMDEASRTQTIAPDPPETVVDVQTGESVPSTDRPTPPEGYGYLEACEVRNGWCNVGWLGEEYKTKLQQVIAVVEQAYQNGVPVKVTSRKAPWLDKVEVWKPAGHSEPLTSEDIAF